MRLQGPTDKVRSQYLHIHEIRAVFALISRVPPRLHLWTNQNCIGSCFFRTFFTFFKILLKKVFRKRKKILKTRLNAILVCLKMVAVRDPAYECENDSNLICIWRYGQQFFLKSSCKRNEHWGIIFAHTPKTVFHPLYGICVSVYGGADNSDLIIIIIIIHCNPRSPASYTN